MSKDVSESDLLIVGSGVAGLTAARRAQQLGLTVTVLEKFDTGPGMGNGRLSGGWFHAAMLDPMTRTPDELYGKLMAEGDGFVRPELARAWADTARRALEFLRAEGGTFGVLNPADESMWNVLMPQRVAGIGRPFESRGPDLLLTRLWRRFVENGGDHRVGHRAVALECEKGRAIGVQAEHAGSRVFLRARSILLADGGIQGNPNLVDRYITRRYKLRGSQMDTGDAFAMATSIGAKPINMEWFYGYALCRDSLTDDRLWPYPAPGALIGAGLLVDAAGCRFTDEGASGEVVANAIARANPPDGCWVIFDSAMWEREGRQGEVPMNPVLVDAGGTVLRADGLRDLAALAGLPAETLRQTVEALNRHWRDRAEVLPPRSGRGRLVAEAPFYAIPVIAGITFAMGGLLVDRFAQVLDQGERPIPGLYAAGGAMGGLQGGPRIAVAGGWSEASSFGLIAAERVAQTLGMNSGDGEGEGLVPHCD